MGAVIAFNPISGGGLARSVAAKLARSLDAPLAEAHRLDAALADQRPDAIVVVGGDGTIRRAAAALLRAACDAPLVVVPAGTANLIARHLRIDTAPDTLIDGVLTRLRSGRARRLDVGLIDGSPFLVMVGVGFDAAVVQLVEAARTGPISMGSYLPAIAAALWRHEFADLDVRADSQRIWAGRPGLAFVCNLPEYGAFTPIAPQAQGDDGLLDLCVLPCERGEDLPALYLKVAAGEHLSMPDAVWTRCREATIESATPTPVQADGESAGRLPVHVRMHPRLIAFLA